MLDARNVTAIVVTYNRLPLLKQCLAALRAQTVQGFTVLLVDNASTDGTADYIKTLAMPGGLTDDTQIRMLLCYLVKVAGPVKRETMQGALLQEQLVNYFEFADALAEVEKQQLVTVDEDGRYTITRRGTTVADTLAYDLPRTVRESAIRAVMQIRSWRHRAASNRAVVQEKDGQFSVVCSIADMGSDVFRMELAMPDKLTAEMIKNNFIAHGSDIFPKLLNALTQPGSEDDRPPAGLM